MSSAVNQFRAPTSLVDEVVRVLTERIIHGQLAPGTHLVEERLAAEFGISRPPIRESFRALASEGLVTLHPRRGVHVRQVTAREVHEIYECRSALEGMAARSACAHLSTVDKQALRGTVKAMRQAVESSDFETFFAKNVEFHAAVARGSENRTLERLLGSLGTQVLRLRYASLSLPGRMNRSLELHEQLMASFEAGEAERAEQITQQIIGEAAAALEGHFDGVAPGRDDGSKD